MFTTIRSSWALLNRRQKSVLSLLTALRSLLNLLDVAGILAVGIIASLALGVTEEIPFLGDPNRISDSEFAILILLTGMVFVVKTILGVLATRQTLHYLASLEISFSMSIAQSLFASDVEEIKRHSRSEIEWKVSRSPSVAFSQVLGQASSLVVDASLGLFITVLFAITDWKTAFFVGLYFGLILLIFQALTRGAVYRAGSTVSTTTVSAIQILFDMVTTFREIVTLSRQDAFLERLRSARSSAAHSQATASVVSAVPRLVIEMGLILGALMLVGLSILNSSIIDASFTLGIYIMGSLKMMSAVLPIQSSITSLRFMRPLAREAQEIAMTIPAALDDSLERGPLLPAPIHGLSVEVSNLSFSYETEIEPGPATIDNLSFSINPGTSVALVGPSGSGKSTLVDLLIGLRKPVRGNIFLNGLSPVDFRHKFPRQIGFVPQRVGLVSGTLEQNIALGATANQIDSAQVSLAIKFAALEEVVDSLPDGVKTDLGKHSDSLSGGQLQRIGLARALYHRPRLLLLDEATSSLDPETESEITKNLADLRGDVTVITVAHRLSSIQHADHVLLMVAGRLVASGTFKELLSDSDILKNYVELLRIAPDQ